jgi:hypothetical protein
MIFSEKVIWKRKIQTTIVRDVCAEVHATHKPGFFPCGSWWTLTKEQGFPK